MLHVSAHMPPRARSGHRVAKSDLPPASARDGDLLSNPCPLADPHRLEGILETASRSSDAVFRAANGAGAQTLSEPTSSGRRSRARVDPRRSALRRASSALALSPRRGALAPAERDEHYQRRQASQRLHLLFSPVTSVAAGSPAATRVRDRPRLDLEKHTFRDGRRSSGANLITAWSSIVFLTTPIDVEAP